MILNLTQKTQSGTYFFKKNANSGQIFLPCLLTLLKCINIVNIYFCGAIGFRILAEMKREVEDITYTLAKFTNY